MLLNPSPKLFNLIPSDAYSNNLCHARFQSRPSDPYKYYVLKVHVVLDFPLARVFKFSKNKLVSPHSYWLKVSIKIVVKSQNGKKLALTTLEIK